MLGYLEEGWWSATAAACGTGRSENFPAENVSLRTAAAENFVIIDDHRPDPARHRRDGPLLRADHAARGGDLPARGRSSTT